MYWKQLDQPKALPLAYMASTVLLEDARLALFGGLTQDESNDYKFKATNEVLYLDLKTGSWQKPAKVFVKSKDDMPGARMGAMMVHYGDKLWVYSGADPYGKGVLYNDFFSFDVNSGVWKREKSYSELNQGEGTMLGQSIRMYSSNAVIYSGGCNTLTQSCEFEATKSILFEQPNAHFSAEIGESDPVFSGRMGHSLVQLGEAVISFGGCSFGRKCSSELLI